MQLIDLLTIFATGFISVFTLGFQSRNVNHGNYAWAAATSTLVGLSQFALWTKITDPDVGIVGGIVYGISGALAIVSAMYVHERFIKQDNGRGP